MHIRFADEADIRFLLEHDLHIKAETLQKRISAHCVLIAEEDGHPMGWLRWNLFWDNTPFMNMIYLLEENRGKGIGKQLVEYWENQMKMLNYKVVMTSTASNEYAQHFYHKLGYSTVGGFLLMGDPYEVILAKYL